MVSTARGVVANDFQGLLVASDVSLKFACFLRATVGIPVKEFLDGVTFGTEYVTSTVNLARSADVPKGSDTGLLLEDPRLKMYVACRRRASL